MIIVKKRINRNILWKKGPVKSLLNGLCNNSGGRNNHGKITVLHRGGGVKRLCRVIAPLNTWMEPNTNNQSSSNIISKSPLSIQHFEYDPNRTAFLALINRSDNSSFYSLASNEMIIDNKSLHSVELPQELGLIPVGKLIYNLNDRYIKAAGTSGRLLKKNESEALIRMPSGEFKSFPLHFKALLGTVSNADHKNEIIGKAGTNRLRGIRPHVRGIAMNPVDHPHGGSNDKIGITPWGKPSKGYKTVRKSKKAK